MSFPLSPSNNQTAVLNGQTYIYSSANSAWTRIVQYVTATTSLIISGTTPTNSTVTGALQVAGGVGIGGGLFVGGVVTATTFVGALTGTATTSTNIAGGAAGSIPIQVSPSVTAFVPLGTSGYVLTAGTNTATWTAVSGLSAGTATTATQVNTVLQTSNATYYPTFVSANNASATGMSVYTTSSFTINPSTGVVAVASTTAATGTNSGALQVAGGVGIGSNLYVGNSATILSTIASTSSVQNNALYIAGGVGIGTSLLVTGPAVFNNSVTFSGAITGTASTASQVNTVLQTGNASYYPTFVNANNASATGMSLYTTGSFVINPSTGFVGIGTISPQRKLNVKGSGVMFANSTGTHELLIGDESYRYFGLYTPSSPDYMSIRNGTTDILKIDALVNNVMVPNGNLGVGVTPNTWYTTFKAIQFGANGSSIFGRSENNTAGMASNAYINAAGAWTYINTNYASYYQQLNGQHQWYIAPSGTANSATTFTTAMTLDNIGNVGINATPNSWYSNRTAIQFGNTVGTVVANNQLDIGSNFYSQVTTSNDVAVATGYSTKYRMADPATGSHSWWVTSASTTAGNAIGGFSQAMTLDRNSNLSIGYTAQQQGATLSVNGGVYVNGIVTATNLVVNGFAVSTSTASTFNGGTITSPLIINNATSATNTTTGALRVTNGGVGVGGSVYVGNRVGFVNTSNVSVVYQFYNASTNSLDTVFG
jgi:hypothetical protein